MNVADDLAGTVLERRRELGLTQRELSQLAGCSERLVRQIEKGKTSVAFDSVIALLDALGLKLQTELRR